MLIVDFEGYEINNKFIFKEFSIIDLVTNKNSHYFIRSPHIDQNPNQQVNWVYKNIHLIPLNYGKTSIKKIYNLLNNQKLILVKGNQKSKLIKKLFSKSNIINLENFGCPKYSEKTSINCSYDLHNNSNFTHCALKKSNFYKDWFMQNGSCKEKFRIFENFSQMQKKHA
jgi:hypothetical protein